LVLVLFRFPGWFSGLFDFPEGLSCVASVFEGLEEYCGGYILVCFPGEDSCVAEQLGFDNPREGVFWVEAFAVYQGVGVRGFYIKFVVQFSR